MEETALHRFCGSPFWDNNITWYTESPDLTSCFEKTVFVWTPCIFLWVFSSIDIYYIFISKTRDIPWNWRNITKLAIVGLLFTICLLDFCYGLYWWNEVFPVDIYTPLIKLVSLALCGTLIFFHRKYGVQSSGLLFIFWFLVFVLGSSQFHTDLKGYLSREGNDMPRVTYLLYYCLSTIMFLIHWISDLPPKVSQYPAVKNPCPETSASFPSRLTFSWFNSLAYLGFKRPLVRSDLWTMKHQDMASEIFPIFDKHWCDTVKKNNKTYKDDSAKFSKSVNSVDISGTGKTKSKPSSILPALIKAFGPTFLFGASLKLVQDLLVFISPELLKYLISFVANPEEPQWRGYFYAAILLVVATLQTLLLSQYFNIMMMIGLRIRTALTSAIYRKALKLSNAARKESTLGEIVNLMSVDAERFKELVVYLNMIWSAPLQITLALVFLWRTLGPCVLAGLAVMIIMIPINGFIANKVKDLQLKQMKNKDERVKMMNEILSGIKVLKLYAWEPSFEQRVLKIREKEIKVLKQSAYLNATTSFIWSCAPFLVSLVTFTTYVLIDENNVLDSSKAFVSLSLFNILRFPLSMLPMMISNAIQTSVSVKRINKFMNSEELDPEAVRHDDKDEDPLLMENGTFSWSAGEEPILHDLSLRVKPGSLVAVVGAVGSGKSSLLSAFLGEMYKQSGKVNTKGSIAYVPQIAWIQNCTLQDNILFGRNLDRKAYQKVVDACALRQDLDMLPGGDQTEIGEKGINLSGGQKQRVSLARAVYSDCDVYFLDDPLSAVDSHVGKHIFENVIGSKGILRKKTRLFVTHSITFLSEVDLIVVLKDGNISEIGTYRELLDRKGAFSEFLTTHLQDIDNNELEDLDSNLMEKIISSNPELQRQLSRQKSVSSDTSSISSLNKRKLSDAAQNNIEAVPNKGEKLIEEEKAEVGGVKMEVYGNYLRAIGPFMCIATVLLNIIFQGFSVGSNFWLSVWSNDKEFAVNNTQDTSKRDMYLEVYGLLGIGQITMVLLATLALFLGTLKAALHLHYALLHAILRVPTSFFDVTPLGRVINRFAKDIDVLDNVLPHTFRGWCNCFFSVIGTLFVISYSTPIFIAVIIPIGFLYYFIQRFYVATSRQLKRLESVSRSPIYSHFGESVSGASLIRAYSAQERFIRESEEKVDSNQVCTYPGIIANRWLAVRLEMVGNLIIFFSALFAVFGRDSLTPGLVGLSVSYSLQITQTLNWLVRMTADVETNIVAVERIKEYADTPQEAPWEITPSLVGSEWPDTGKVEFVDFKVRYREGLDLVLKGLKFEISGGEKVGIVGRTGAGKSSLTLSLFRIIESADGKIMIDGIDISNLGLHSLRSRLTIIPQDPVLFSGTLRMNLDPFSHFNDEQVWRALELAHLKTFAKGLPAGLQHEVSEGGDNLSVGQRQLICLARALLRKTKVLILDEATAAVDLETDDLIQKTIRSEFSSCTVLTIAHRINTIMDSDRVLVLDRGVVVEFDAPHVLLKNRSSIFYGMAHDAGLV
ncbi:multidrug resistance-associated protein 1 isoform X1 [Halyomorpha halys]|uniref:multidrug resistance-associated protein 1 isoform X1 n=1 Tax=Halyomorpha halys TaxID=286706 RepID=UPI0006D51564|nr:multidrug resistance-associated protein 1 isoform X1 [Halyomorpha halys]